MDDKQVLAYAKRNYLIEKRLKALEFTLRKMSENGDTNKLLKKLEKTERNNKVYKKIIKEISKKYVIKEDVILEILDKVKGKNDERQR